jgi:hypothetical protein
MPLSLCIKFISRAAFRPTCDARANMRASESYYFTFINTLQPHFQEDLHIERLESGENFHLEGSLPKQLTKL